MCTTIMVLSTIALLLRRMFVNRVKPFSNSCISAKYVITFQMMYKSQF
uniref:Uncharacterized protein n=1 Tax=Sinocyclocheilus grahami TaxID=75366 RepID=A0A672M5K6_SINGR